MQLDIPYCWKNFINDNTPFLPKYLEDWGEEKLNQKLGNFLEENNWIITWIRGIHRLTPEEYIRLYNEVLVALSFESFKSDCDRAHYWAIITNKRKFSFLNWIIWRWHNHIPWWLIDNQTCSCWKNEFNLRITDTTCCIHAEASAIYDAMRNNPQLLENAVISFLRYWNPIDSGVCSHNNPITEEAPHCTSCSKLILDVWIKVVTLLQKDSNLDTYFLAYDSTVYDIISHNYENMKEHIIEND